MWISRPGCYVYLPLKHQPPEKILIFTNFSFLEEKKFDWGGMTGCPGNPHHIILERKKIIKVSATKNIKSYEISAQHDNNFRNAARIRALFQGPTA